MPKASPKPLCPKTLRWVARELHADARELRRFDFVCPVAQDKHVYGEKLLTDARRIERAAKRKGRGGS